MPYCQMRIAGDAHPGKGQKMPIDDFVQMMEASFAYRMWGMLASGAKHQRRCVLPFAEAD